MTTCWRAPTTTDRARPAEQRSASWLPIVPDGTKSAASLPTRSANASCETVDGRVLAVAVVADLGLGHRGPHRGVGRVTVSLRRSTHPSPGASVLRSAMVACSPVPCADR